MLLNTRVANRPELSGTSRFMGDFDMSHSGQLQSRIPITASAANIRAANSHGFAV